MSGKIKFAAAAAGLAATVLVIAACAYLFSKEGAGLMAYIPEPGAGAPYVLLEAEGGSYPKALSAALADGISPHLKKGTPRGAVLAAAALASDAALLLERGADGSIEIYCAARFSDADTKLLKKGRLPAAVGAALGAADAEAADGGFSVRSETMTQPVYYAVAGKETLFAASLPALRRMTLLEKNPGAMKDKKWTQEKDWPAHIEICDGGLLTERIKEKFPITVEAAWRIPEKDRTQGEARWAFVNMGAGAKACLSSALKAKKWKISDCVIPQPLLLSAGLNLPPLKGSPEEWPFPLSSVGEIAGSLGLDDSKTREIFSGGTIFSLGGQNKILWFSLPGFLTEFSGRPELMKELVAAFWENLFFGAEPEPMEGFEYGGSASVPFSVVGAGRGGVAVLGLASPQSITTGGALPQFLSDDEEAVGWLLADFPRIGKAVSEMTKMNSFLNEEENQDFYSDSYSAARDGYTWGAENDPEPLQPEFSISPFDQEIADSFGAVLQKLGRVMVVWEKPLSGRINWYHQEK